MKTLILCNGEPPPRELFEQCLQWADVFIAADGGGNTARQMGHLPEVVIGDMDSYRPHDHEPYEVIEDPDQYSNDLEKALDLAVQKGATKVRVLGATGERLDHTLKNLSVLKQFNDRFESIIFLEKGGIIQLLPADFSREFPISTPISLFPLSGKVTGITTRGLKYPLEDDFLENGVQDGSSNSVVENPVTITHNEGDLLLFIAH